MLSFAQIPAALAAEQDTLPASAAQQPQKRYRDLDRHLSCSCSYSKFLVQLTRLDAKISNWSPAQHRWRSRTA